jgi:PadR family transcriptional regulator PadR
MIRPQPLQDSDVSRASGLVRVGLLLLLADRPGHGYELTDRLSQELGIATDMSSLYRTLRALERAGEVSSRWTVTTTGPARRVYAITPSGAARLRGAVGSLERHATVVGHLVDRARQTRTRAGLKSVRGA